MEKKLIKLSDRSIVEVEGSESENFLQGIITCNVEKIKNKSSYGSILTPQGKLLYDFIISRKANKFFIDIYKPNIDNFMKLLNMYKLRSNLTLTKREDLSVFVDIDNNNVDMENIDPRLATIGSRKILDSNYKHCSNDKILYEKKLIKLGIAEVGDAIEPGEIFPIEANLDYLNGIDFQKGCFIGQEVSSRMYRKGKAKKRIVSFTSNDSFTNNDELVYNERTIGTVIKKIEDYGIALIKIDKLINPERETITITSKDKKKKIDINMPSFFPI
jgi:folate-binding protein YgfZ